MAKTITVSDEDASIIHELAREEGKDVSVLFGELVKEEDRRRHIFHEPFAGRIRVSCSSKNCREARQRHDRRLIDEFSDL